MDIFKYGFTNLFNFNGRVSRSVYFIYLLTINSLLNFLMLVLLKREMNPYIVVGSVFILSVVLVTAINVRRLHDSGHSGKSYLLLLIPILGPLILLVYTFLVDESDNKYGSFIERKVSSLNKNIAIIIFIVLGFVTLVETLVSTGVSAKIAQETFLEVQDNAQASSLASSLEMIGNQAKAESFMESDGVLTVELLQRVFAESNLPSNFVGSNTETGILVIGDDYLVGSIDIDPSSDDGFTIRIG